MKFLKLLLALVVVSTFTFADAFKHPFLWKAQKNKQSFYLFGTIHLPSPELSTLPSKLKDALDDSDAIYTEIDMSFMNQMKAMTFVLRKDGKPLKSILPKKLYFRTENYLKSISPALTLEPFSQMKIWALVSTIGLLEDQLKYAGLTPIDDIIFTYGKEHNKTIGGIEPIEEQLGYFDTFTLKEQILMLESTLDYLEKHHNYTQKMKELYLEGDEVKLLAFTNEQFENEKYKKLEKKFMQVLLYQRNEIMAKRIVKLLKENPKTNYLFAFGVMHFLDKKSVIEKLEKEDFILTRVP